ncbi:MAG: hypothetical protein MJZ26_03705 [Fibrobacter sp.]|nr:hypothetical protein [Fibrobacter sp.]
MPSVLKNISYTFLSNIVCLLVSVFVAFFVPKALGVENYGFFQLYLFYINYTGFLHFGWADGIYLRYGGAYYESLDKKLFQSQFGIFCLFESAFSILFCICALKFAPTTEKTVVFTLIGLCILFLMPKTFLQYVLQATNRIKEYSFLIMIERACFGFGSLLIVFVGLDSFALVIAADLFGKFVSMCYGIFQCRDQISLKISVSKKVLKEVYENICVGSKLMFANIASLLILGLVRWSIERKWDVSTFGKISLTLTISNLVMVFIRSVSMVLLPTLRRIDESKYSEIYREMKVGLMLFTFGILFAYYPLYVFLTYWLPSYADCLKYMAILFPICFYEGKLSMLVETYLKTLRMEKKIFFTNLLTLVLSAVLTWTSIFLLENLTYAVFAILIIFAFRTSLGEFFLSKKMQLSFVKGLIIESFMIACFVCSTWFIDGFSGFLLYLLVYMTFLFVHRHYLKNIICRIKNRRKL